MSSSTQPKNTVRNELLAGVVVLLIAAVLFIPMMIHWRTMGDANPHVERATMLITGDYAFMGQFPHILYPSLIAIPHQLIPGLDLYDIGVALTSGLYLLLTGIIYAFIRRMAAPQFTYRNVFIVGFVTLGLMFVAPINLLTPTNLYFGYITPHVYHNPTITLMKPLALLLFIGSLHVFDSAFAQTRRLLWMVGFALLSLACIMSKPSFVIVLLPALALVTLYKLVKRQYINWWLLLGGIVIPAGALLGWLTLAWSSSGVAFEPLRTFWEWSIHYQELANVNLLPKFILSFLFPLLVYGLYFRAAIKDLMLNFAWIGFLIGAFYTYFLVEVGDPPSGNMVWSAQSSLLVLFVVSAIFLLKQNRWLLTDEKRPQGWWRLALCVTVFALHLISGLNWYYLHLIKDDLKLLYRWW